MAERKASAKKSQKASQRAKQSVEKGRNFEEKVASLYHLLGASTIQNIEICQKKVDLFARFPVPGSPTGHRVLVECKDEKRALAQNQRILQMQGLLDIARKSNEADSAAIITSVSWGDKAKALAHSSGIELLTYEEKISQLIDFSKYQKEIIRIFERGEANRTIEPPLGKYYIPSKAEKIKQNGEKEIDDCEKYFFQWVKAKDTLQHLAVLGEYGIGKSSFCNKIAYELAQQYLKEPSSNRIPILFNLREFTKTLKIESLITSFLDEKCEAPNPKFSLFKAMNDAGIFVLIFDGFDEMATKVDADTLQINLSEIEKLAGSPKSKIILTSRTEYFTSIEEENKSLHPKGDMLSSRESEYQILTLLPWDDKQVAEFLEKRVPLTKGVKENWNYYLDKIKNIPGLADLSHRPVLLDMIVKTLPRLISSGKPINRPNLYETYLEGEIKRQKISKHRTLILNEPARLQLLQQLASIFYEKELNAINYSDALQQIETSINPPRNELEMYTRDFLTCSFLIRKGDEYQFSHRSIMEYLVAKFLFNEIQSNTNGSFNNKIIAPVIVDFIAEMEPETTILWEWLEYTRGTNNYKYLGGNSASILCKISVDELSRKDLSTCHLMGANLRNANLIGSKLNGAIFEKVDLAGALYLKPELLVAQLQQAVFLLFCLVNPKKFEKQFKVEQDEAMGSSQFSRMLDFVSEKLSTQFNVQLHRTSLSRFSDIKFTILTLRIEIVDGSQLIPIQNYFNSLDWVYGTIFDSEDKNKIMKSLNRDEQGYFDRCLERSKRDI